MKKALILMPTPPFPALGADEQNRLGVIRLLKKLGYGTISIVAKAREDQLSKRFLAEESAYGVSVVLVERGVYTKHVALYWIARIVNPFRWDGATDEYFDHRFKEAVFRDIAQQKPDLIVVEYNFLWPAVRFARRAGIPVLMRSHNFEALHFLSEDGISFVNLLKFFTKLLSEWRSVMIADVLLPVTQKEAREYRWLCPRSKIFTLHSGALPDLVNKRHKPQHHSPVSIVFLGSRYSIPHNVKAVQFLIEQLMPELERMFPGVFLLSITGGKLPTELANRLPNNTQYVGYVEDVDTVFATADIVVAPRIAGHGMQLKVFEPLCRGVPTITSRRAIGAYPFEDKKEVFFANTVTEFISALSTLRSFEARSRISDASHALSEKLFGEKATLGIIRRAIAYASNTL